VIEIFRTTRERSSASLIIGAVIVGFSLAVAAGSFFWTPHDPIKVDLSATLLPTGSAGHPLGTDQFGRDVLSQIMTGARTSLTIAGGAVLLAVVVGVAIGSLGAMLGGTLDDFLMRLMDIVFAFPGILIAIMLAVSLGSGHLSVVIAIALGYVAAVARLCRSATLQVKERDFVLSAYAYGRSQRFVFFKHIVPNISSVLLVQASALVGLGILLEAALAYLGIGPPPPTPSWGRMLRESQSMLAIAPGLAIWPGVAIALTVLGFNQLGDGFRDLFDPRSEQLR
jgi:peptide/nickel transport system permease protein